MDYGSYAQRRRALGYASKLQVLGEFSRHLGELFVLISANSPYDLGELCAQTLVSDIAAAPRGMKTLVMVHRFAGCSSHHQ